MSKLFVIPLLLALSCVPVLGCQDPVIGKAIEDGAIKADPGVSVPVQQGIFEERINWSDELKRIQSDEILKPVAEAVSLTVDQLREALTLAADLEKSRIQIIIDDKKFKDARLYAKLLANEYSVYRIKYENDRLSQKTGLEVRLKLLKLEEGEALTILQGLHLQDDEDPKEGEKPRWKLQQEKWEKLRGDRIKTEEELKKFYRQAMAKR